MYFSGQRILQSSKASFMVGNNWGKMTGSEIYLQYKDFIITFIGTFYEVQDVP